MAHVILSGFSPISGRLSGTGYTALISGLNILLFVV
jgi:hypothetical protein